MKNFASAVLLLCVSTVAVWAGGLQEPEAYVAEPPAEVNVTELVTPITVPVRPEENPKVTLTVDQAVEYALANSETLKTALIDLEMKRRAKQYTWNVIVPTVSATASLARSDAKASMSGSEELLQLVGTPAVVSGFQTKIDGLGEKDNWALACGLSASLTLNAALVEGIKATCINYEAGLISWEQTKKQTERDIRKLFYGLLLQQRNITLQRESLETAHSRMIQVHTDYKNGRVPELSYLQTQVAYENIGPIVLQLEQALQQQMKQFCFLLGYPFGTELTLDGAVDPEFIEFDAAALAAQHAGSRLDVIALQKSIEIMKTKLCADRLLTYTPSLSLSASWSPLYAPVFNDGSWRQNDADALAVSATLSFNLTGILPFMSASQALKDSEANIAKMELGLSQTLQQGEMEIYMLVDLLKKSEASIKVSEANITLAQKAYNQTVAGYNAGTQELLSVRDAESQLNQAKYGMLSEQYNYISALLDLAYALGTDMSELKNFAKQ